MWTAEWFRILVLPNWATHLRQLRLTRWPLLLMAITPFEALNSDTTESDQTLSACDRFAAIPPYLKDPEGSETAQRQWRHGFVRQRLALTTRLF